MKKTLLLTTILSLLFFGVVWSQTASSIDNSPQFAALSEYSGSSFQTPKIKVYPNPATHYIMLSKVQAVRKIKILSLIGNAIKTYKVQALEEKYDVADLPNGLYLVQLLDYKNKVITTQRLNKRWYVLI